jgi:translation initiation factor IF-2
VIAFNTPIDKRMVNISHSKKVKTKGYQVIYKLLDDLKESMSELLPPEETFEVVGEANILQTFTLNAKGNDPSLVAGCRITTGKITRASNIR